MPFSRKFNWKIFFYILGKITSFIGCCFIFPGIIALIYKESNPYVFFFSAAISLFLGLSLLYINKNHSSQLSKRDGRIVVGLIWFITPFIGAIPYFFYPQYFTIIDAFFESFSGFSTTGSTIISNLEDIPRSLFLWRSMTQWIGGLGFMLFIIVLMNNLRNGSNYLFNAEFTSLDKERVRPHIKSTVYRIFYIYFGLSFISFIFLLFGDMDTFTAFCHSIGAVSTGGFSTVNGNIGEFSIYTQYVIMITMFLSGISYLLIYWLIKGKLKKVIEDEQFKSYSLLIFVSSVILGITIYLSKDFGLEQTFRTTFFHIISVVSTTGYEFANNQNFGAFAFIMIILLMFIGGCSSSSSTGLKIIRVVLLLRFSHISLKRMFHPKAIIPVRYNGKTIRDESINLVFGFFFLYLLIFITGAFSLTVLGNDFIPSLAMSVANLSNIGPVIGDGNTVMPYYNLNDESKIILMILMMAGRLEIYSFFALLSRSIWLKN